MENIKYKKVQDHVEVYQGNEFLFSEDTKEAAHKELIRCICPYTKKYCCNPEDCENCDTTIS